MRLYRLQTQAPSAKHAIGSTLGEKMLQPLVDELQAANAELHIGSGELVVLDFTGIESATASFLKATVIRLLRAGSRFVDEPTLTSGAATDLALNIYPSVYGLAADVREELTEILASQRLVCLEAKAWNTVDITAAKLHGPLEGSLWTTLYRLLGTEGATAAELHERYPSEGINPTAWNNRLAELYRLRLVRRVRRGRPWLYTSIAREVQRG